LNFPFKGVGEIAPADLGDEDAKAALKRLDCPVVLKDKRGNVVSNLCW
jgi:hypothetical protein